MTPAGSSAAAFVSVATDDRDFVVARVLDAPRDRVFRAWTEPAHLARWWGPVGSTVAVCEVDARQGGAYRIVTRSPEGVDHPVRGVFLEVIPPRRLVFTSVVDARPSPEALSTVTFEERGGKTLLTLRTRFATPAVREALARMGMAEGWAERLERLRALLAASPGGAR